jgi:hypothetical protein
VPTRRKKKIGVQNGNQSLQCYKFLQIFANLQFCLISSHPAHASEAFLEVPNMRNVTDFDRHNSSNIKACLELQAWGWQL